MATTQTVNIDVNANTQDAEQQVSRLENNIKTLDGAINLVGGSIEVLAGGLALAGAVTEEQAERFQTAAVGAIALADGSKRIIEGYKTLATETNILSKAQKLYNFVLNANPLGLVIIAATALAGAYLLLRNRTDASTEAAKRSRTARLEELDAIDGLADANLRLARAKGASEEEIRSQFARWNKGRDDDGNLIVLNGLTTRRKEEADLYFKEPSKKKILIALGAIIILAILIFTITRLKNK